METYTVPCPRSGLSIELEHNPEDIYFPWAAFLHVDIGGWQPLFLNTCGETPMEACRALNDAIHKVRRVVWNISPEREDVENMLDLLWQDTLNIGASAHSMPLAAVGGA